MSEVLTDTETREIAASLARRKWGEWAFVSTSYTPRQISTVMAGRPGAWDVAVTFYYGDHEARARAFVENFNMHGGIDDVG
jgi:hypothetical protein